MPIATLQQLLTDHELALLRAKVFCLKSKEWDVTKLGDLGWEYGYPICCIYDFVEDMADGKAPAQLRQLPGVDWIPCKECFEKYKNAPHELQKMKRS